MFRQFRAGEAPRLATTRPRYEMVAQTSGNYAGRAAANAVVEITDDPGTDFTLLGIQPSGAITQVIASRRDFEQLLERSQDGRPISDEGNGRYRLHIDIDHDGWSGLLLIGGRGPFPGSLVAPELGARGPDWRERFAEAAGNLGWRVEMVWFQTVNETPDAVPAAAEGDKP